LVLGLFKINVTKGGYSATYMPHSQQRHAYKSNTHKIRRNLKTKYNDNKKNDQYLVYLYTEVGT